jgi:diadenylate cyclase
VTAAILDIFHAIRIQDILDVLLVAVMISALLIWFKNRASRFVFVGISLLGIVYVLARFFQLYLTTVVLQGFFAILIFVLVIIFQEDLRRFFERLAMWGGFRKKIPPVSADAGVADTIARTVESLARIRRGALIVLRGGDPLDRHLSQGTRLDGVVSQQLLESIFDPHSPGHDGAVVIEGGRVVQFGSHLPLSVNAAQFGYRGLRHAAALGLAELSDAICLVVSEERGTVTIAQGEELRVLATREEIQAALAAFLARIAPPRQAHVIGRWLKENTREKIIALVLACLLWLIFGYQREQVRREYSVPIAYTNLAPDWVIEAPAEAEARVMLAGSSQAFQFLKPETLKISVNLSPLARGKKKFTLTKDMVDVPPTISVVSIEPGEISVVASRLVPVSVPIGIDVKNAPPPGRAVEKITVIPGQVRVLVPHRLAQERISIRTAPIDLKTIPASTSLMRELVVPQDVQFEGGRTPTVRVVVKIRRTALRAIR